MCEPVSMGIMAGATLLQGITGANAARAEARMMNQQGEVFDRAARDTEKQGLRDEEAFRTQVRQFQGQQRSAIGASGVVGSEGSAARIQDDTALQGEIDALTLRNNAYLEAWGLRTQASQARAGAKLKRYEGRATLLTSTLSAGAYAARGYSAARAPAGGPDAGTVSANYINRSGYS